MVKLLIDSRPAEVPEGTTVLEAAEALGIHIPRFCYHKRLSIAGNCRMCLVEIEGAKNPVISCKEPVREGMVVSTDSELARRCRADVLEFILLNHPVDCPICDQAGECVLQDYYFEHSLRPSRLIDPKVHKPKAQQIGPYVILDAERCVECTRCVRFCEEIAGKHEIGLFERGDHSTIGVAAGERLANPYSLCAVDLCPVGALTSIDFRFKKRVWKLKSSPSICLGCATGCNVWIDHADGIAYRYRPRENEAVNKSWLCDAGRMTYKTLTPENRVLVPYLQRDGEVVSATWEEALARAAELAAAAPRNGVVGVLSAGSSNEENAAFAALCREGFGAKRIVWSGRDPDPAFGDRLLRDADRNANAAGVQKLASERLGALAENAGAVVLSGLEGKDLMELIHARPAWAILVASEFPRGGRWADIVLPKATHAERAGTFVNRQGIAQRAEKAFEPLGESLTVEGIAERISTQLRKDVP